MFVTVVTVLVVASVSTAAAAPVPNWYGLGPEACHGETCEIEQFCSDSRLPPLRGCRNCTDIVGMWCKQEVPEKILTKYPSCQAACERLLTEKREAASQNKTDELEIDNDHLRSSLRDTEKKLHETENKTRYMDASLTTARKDKSKLQAELDMLRE
ncbi:hypothetical protein BaRGS_00006719 [Batillaria attramentaria]|uniref:Secreted protein n=1 Tax=Batillaria attramentaria TaxID=370345 RepID=A0ABD0LRL3_9CAEN